MIKIRFDIKEAFYQLRDKGYVYTLRKWYGYPKLCLAVSYFDSNFMSTVDVEFVKKISSIDELDDYVGNSGFINKEDWWRTAMRINNKVDKFNLFKVKLNSNLNRKLDSW